MPAVLHTAQLGVKTIVVRDPNDLGMRSSLPLRMKRPRKVQKQTGKPRLHFIPEWAAARGLSRAELARRVDTNKSNPTHWFKGTLPKEEHLSAIAAVLCLASPTSLFHHPNDEWVIQFFRERDDEERARMRQTLEAAFPRKRP